MVLFVCGKMDERDVQRTRYLLEGNAAHNFALITKDLLDMKLNRALVLLLRDNYRLWKPLTTRIVVPTIVSLFCGCQDDTVAVSRGTSEVSSVGTSTGGTETLEDTMVSTSLGRFLLVPLT